MSKGRTNSIDIDDLKSLLLYNPDTGKLFWRQRGDRFLSATRAGGKEAARVAWEKRVASRPAALTATNSKGYLCGMVLGVPFLAHRVAWALSYGRWPESQIDHVNRDKKDNRLSNLREATASQNRLNQRTRSNSKSGVAGVSWDKRKKKWVAQATFEGRRILFKRFSNIEDAKEAYLKVASVVSEEFRGPGCR